MKFHAGDLVDIVPYDAVERHYGISKRCWENQRSRNPQTIKTVISYDDFLLENDCCKFTWPSWALVLHESPVSFPKVEDLL